MSENLKDILSHLNPDIDQETLLLYLQGKLSTEQQHREIHIDPWTIISIVLILLLAIMAFVIIRQKMG